MIHERARTSGYSPENSRSLPGQNRQPAPLSWEEIVATVDDDRPLKPEEQAESHKDTAALWLISLFMLGGSVAAIAAATQQAVR